jgi:alkanesulfonate monooxygenase SsuD/methylene tetrahydromethanopterin reductase-like flavin-dependent oxidoreductase (luciferase family)
MVANHPFVLGIELDGEGSHPAAWRRAGHPPSQFFDPGRLTGLAQTAERAGFTFATFEDDIVAPGSRPDVVGRIGAVERAAFVTSSLSMLAVVPGVSTTYSEPFHVSTQLASIDHLAAGRAGWLVSASPDPGAARAWGRPPVTSAEDRRREVADSIEVVRSLWDSWEDDAVIRDVASSRYLDRDRLHYVDFVGASYSVKGPSIVPRSPQGQLVVFADPDLAADDQIDVALIAAPDLAGVAGRAGVVRSARKLAELEVALDTERASSGERLADLERHGPWPDRGRLRYVGGASGLVDLVRELAGVVDGVRLHPLVTDEDLAVLSQLVLPPLSLGRLAGRPLPGATLQATLGLPRPANRFEQLAALAAEGGAR